MEKVRPGTGREAGLGHGRERPPLATISAKNSSATLMAVGARLQAATYFSLLKAVGKDIRNQSVRQAVKTCERLVASGLTRTRPISDIVGRSEATLEVGACGHPVLTVQLGRSTAG